MTSTLQISPELRQTVLLDKINEAHNDLMQFPIAQLPDQALLMFYQILNNLELISDRQERESRIAFLIQEEQRVFQPLTQLPRQQQDKWIEWLKKAHQYALNLGENVSAIARHLILLAKAYQILGQTDLCAIALQQATEAAQQISDPLNRTQQFTQLATLRLQFQQKAEAQQALIEALADFEKIPVDEPFGLGYLHYIALLYIQMGEAQQALALADKFARVANVIIADVIRQEVVRDAIKRGDLHLAQAVTAKIQVAEIKANALVEMAVYWATHHQPRLGNRLFAQALKRVAKEESAQDLQSRLIETYSTSSQLTIALNAAQRLTQDGAKAIALTAIAVAYAKANQSQQAEKILAQLIDLNRWEDPLMPVAVNTGQYNLAMKVLNTLPNNADFSSKPGWYRQIVQAPLFSKHFDKALELAKQIPHDFWPEERNSSLQEIAVAYANAQQWNRAIEVVTQIQNTTSSPYQVFTQAELAAIAPTPEEFTSLIQRAIAQTPALKSIEHQALVLVAIAHAYLHFDDEEQTQSFLQQAIQIAQQVEEQESRGRLFVQMTDYLIQKQQYNAALTIAQANPVRELQAGSYSYIWDLALPSYSFDVALQVLELSLVPDTQATQLLAIAKTYAQLGRNEDAMVLLDRAFEVAQKIADPESRVIQFDEYTQLDDYNDRRSQYTRLVKQYVALGQLDKAQQVIEKVQASSLRDYLQAWIAC